MYGLTRFNSTRPADPFSALARDLFSFTPPAVAPVVVSRNAPRFDFIESSDGYLLRGDLPGVRDENLDITVHEGELVVRGTRSEDTVTEGSEFIVQERSYGEFGRRLRLPKNADADKIEAKLEHGVLTVSIPKKQELQARKIKIS